MEFREKKRRMARMGRGNMVPSLREKKSHSHPHKGRRRGFVEVSGKKKMGFLISQKKNTREGAPIAARLGKKRGEGARVACGKVKSEEFHRARKKKAETKTCGEKKRSLATFSAEGKRKRQETRLSKKEKNFNWSNKGEIFERVCRRRKKGNESTGQSPPLYSARKENATDLRPSPGKPILHVADTQAVEKGESVDFRREGGKS